MKLHEYQAKGLFRDYGVSVPDGIVAETVDAAVDAARRLEEENDATLFIVKAQIHAGGRGKGGGVKLAHSVEEVREHADNILGMDLVTHQTGPEGQTVRKILVTEGVDIDQEYYLGVTLDRETSMNAIMVSTEGGVDIETVAEESPEKIQRVWVDPSIGLRPFQTRQLAFAMGLEGDAFKQAVASIQGLYEAFEENDCTLAEINPLVQTPGGDIEAVDAKVNLDDNALFRHPDLEEMRDLHEEDPLADIDTRWVDVVEPKYVAGYAAAALLGGLLVLAVLGVVTLPGIGSTAGPPDVPDAPGSADSVAGLSLADTEAAYVGVLNDRRTAEGAGALARNATADAAAAYYNKATVAAVAGDGDGPSREAFGRFALPCDRPSVVSYRVVPERTDQSVGEFESERALATALVDSYVERGNAFRDGATVGVDVHVAPGDTVSVTHVVC